MIAGMKKLTLAATTGDIDRLVRELVWLESVEVIEQASDAELPPGLYACDNAQNTAALERDLTRLAAASETLAPFGSGKKGKMLPFHWRGGYLTRAVLDELLDLIKKAGEEKGKTARIALNWPQAVLRLEYVEDGQEKVTLEEANEGEQE